jgi:hypothetical protein
MRRIRIRRPSPALIVAFIALMAALAPTATALKGVNLVSSNDIITGAVKKSDAGRDSVGISEAREDDDEGGGFTGQQINEDKLGTVPSSSGLELAGVIGEDGKLVRGHGVTTAKPGDTGVVAVTFSKDVNGCSYLATLAGDSAGQIVVAEPSASDPKTVSVSTFEGGAPKARAFNVAASC